jgi:hypothetical protein
MCLSYQNPTQREQNADEATCNARLAYSSPELTLNKQKRLTRLANSHNPKLRAAAAGNPMASVATIFHLASDAEVLVRSWAVRNPAAPEWILVWKAKSDPDAGIRAYAKFRLDMITDSVLE